MHLVVGENRLEKLAAIDALAHAECEEAEDV
jgi:hypothetical protein